MGIMGMRVRVRKIGMGSMGMMGVRKMGKGSMDGDGVGEYEDEGGEHVEQKYEEEGYGDEGGKLMKEEYRTEDEKWESENGEGKIKKGNI